MPRLHPLQKIDVNDYDMNLDEKLAGAALKQYFLMEPEKAKRTLEGTEGRVGVTQKQIVFWNPLSSDRPVLLQSDINGPALADLIDTAARYTTALSVQNGAKAEDPAYHLLAAVSAAKICGKAIVQNMSVDFLDFLRTAVRLCLDEGLSLSE